MPSVPTPPPISTGRPQELAAAIGLSLLMATQPAANGGIDIGHRDGRSWKLQGRWNQLQARAEELSHWR